MSTPAVRSRKTVALSARVSHRLPLTPRLVRLVLTSDDFSDFDPSAYTDSYVKLVFFPSGAKAALRDAARPVDISALRERLPAHLHPRLRTYTVRHFDPQRSELTLDFVVHGHDELSTSIGIASEWAVTAQPGDEVLLLGPGGGYTPDHNADWYLLAGDESALPAVSAALEQLPAKAHAQILLEIHDPNEIVAIDTELTVHWIFRGDRPLGQALVDAVTTLDFPTGRVDAFVHGEAGFVKQLRTFLLKEKAVPAQSLSISGYWRQGCDDEQWRAVKRDWAKD